MRPTEVLRVINDNIGDGIELALSQIYEGMIRAGENSFVFYNIGSGMSPVIHSKMLLDVTKRLEADGWEIIKNEIIMSSGKVFKEYTVQPKE